jgi:chromosome segregation ATPase
VIEYPTKNIELYAKDEEIAQLKAELSQELSTTQRLKSELMSSVEDRDKKDAEIYRLKKSFEQTSLIVEQLFEKHLAEKDAEIEQLRNEIVVLQRNELYFEELVCRAADALEPLNEIYPQKKRSDLIAELRKAAQ